MHTCSPTAALLPTTQTHQEKSTTFKTAEPIWKLGFDGLSEGPLPPVSVIYQFRLLGSWGQEHKLPDESSEPIISHSTQTESLISLSGKGKPICDEFSSHLPLPLAHLGSRSSLTPLPGVCFPAVGGAVVKVTCHVCEQNVCGLIY